VNLYTKGRQVADTLLNFVSGLGTAKDPRSATQFIFNELNRTQLEQMYRSDWLARRIVDLPAEDATREWRQWTGDRAKLEKIDALEKKLDIQKKTRQALQRARLYGGAALVLGVDQGQPEEELDLDDVGLNDLKFVVVVNRYELSAGPRIFNVDSDWYTRPEYYTVSTPMFGFFGEEGGSYPTGGTTSPFVTPNWAQGQAPPPPKAPGLPDKNRVTQPPNYGMIRMHPSRVIEFTGNELPDWRLAPLGGGWGDSVLQTVDDALRDFAMIVSGLASMINDMKMDVIKVPDLSRKLSTDDITRKTLERFGLANMAKSSINTLLLDKEEEWDRIQTSFGSTPELIKVAMTLACAAGGVPETRIMGNAPNKGLAAQGNSGGEVDIRNYYDDIGSKQKSQYKPMMRPLDRCLQQSAIGRYDPSIDYSWNPLYQPTAQELAAMALAKAQTTQVYVTTGLINEDALREAVISQLTEDKIYPSLEDAIDEYGSKPEEPDPAQMPLPPTPPPGMMPKGQFEPNPFHMMRAQGAQKSGQPVRVPPNKPTQPKFFTPPKGAVPPTKDGLEDFNPYHDPETGRFISGEAGRANVHRAGVSAVAGAVKGSVSHRAMQQRQSETAPDDVVQMAAKLAPVHHQVSTFLATEAVKAGVHRVIGNFVAHHSAGVAKETFTHSLKTGVESALDYMIGTVAAHAAGLTVATAVPHFAVAVAAGYGVHLLLHAASKHGLNVENARKLLGSTLHYLADHYHALRHGIVGDADDDGDPVLAAIITLLPHFPRGDDGPITDFNPYHDPKSGEFTTGEGGFLATGGAPDRPRGVVEPSEVVTGGPLDVHQGNYGLTAGDAEKYKALRSQWSKVNNALLANIEHPDGPEANAALDQMEAIAHQMHQLHADPGGLMGIKLPGGPRDVTIVGAGPGGMNAAINGGIEGLDTLLIEANPVAGGQAKFSSRIENLGGFPAGVPGKKLTGDMLKQASRLGAETKLGVRVTGMSVGSDGMKHLTLSNGEKIDTRAVILAGGLEFRPMTFPGSDGPGVFVGDGEGLAFKAAGGNAVVVGGSNGAAQAALGAAQTAKHVYIISRSPIKKGMSAYQVDALHNNQKVTVIEGDEVDSMSRDAKGNPVTVHTKQGQELPATAFGVFLGSAPKTDWLRGTGVEVDDGSQDAARHEAHLPPLKGKIRTDEDFETAVPGVFAVGDMRTKGAGRVGVAMGEGQQAIRHSWNYLEGLRHKAGLPSLTEDALIAPEDDTVMHDLISRVFALDKENPWFGQTVEPR
jgi:hypothetical protein